MIIVGGDFRQILPVILKGARQDIVSASINASYLWEFCLLLNLTKIMRLQIRYSISNVEMMKNFLGWLLSIGDGRIGETSDEDVDVEIPDD